VEAIGRECDAVAGLVRRLLDFSKPARLEAKPVDVNGCLRNVLFLVHKQVAKGKIEMKLDLQVGLSPVLGEANQLEQVFLNLLMNAWHAMPAGGELRIRSFASRGENPTIGVEIADTGVGIPEANLGRIFDPFFTTRPPGKGTGLGLAITRRIVTDHGGTISVRSREGKGTTFVVELPAAKEVSE
jgi:two-component system NtrC family sensor kinase